jgi:hypothetical protein
VPHDLYLILHKVRGEPTYDVASPLQIGGEAGWIVATSGHRAYPWKLWPLADLGFGDPSPIPPNWPDHYQATKAAPPGRSSAAHDISIHFGG